MIHLSGVQNINLPKATRPISRKDFDCPKAFQEAKNAPAKGATVKQPEFEGGIAVVGLIAMVYLFRGIMRRLDFLIYP